VNKSIRNAILLACATVVPATLLAAEAASDTGGLEEVVITAQKRTERLADVPVAASVVSSDTVDKLNAGDISDLNRLVPSVQLNGTINGRVPMGIRGISSVSNEGTVGLASGVAIMIDGVPVPSDSRAGNALEDVQSIEVLKGPQATLGGRTAAQGVINIVTRKPSDTLTGSLGLTATDDNEYRASGFLAGPITSGIDYSLSAYYTKRDFPIKNLHLGKTTQEKVYGARGKLLFKPTENLDITLMARVGKDDSDGFNFVYTHTSPGIYLLTGNGGPPFLAQDVLLPGITPSLDNQYYSSPNDVYSTVKDTDFSADIQYRIGDLTLGSTTAYMHEKQVNVQDLFAVDVYFFNLLTGAPCPGPGSTTGAPEPPCFYNTQTQHIDVKQFSEELKLASPTDRDFSYLVGVFYSDTKVAYQLERNLLPALQNLDVRPDTKTTDVYGRATWKFAPQWAVVAGLRYNYDQLSYDYNQISYTASFPPPVIYTGLTASDSHSESTAVGDLSFQYKFNPDSMGYFTYARGYAPAAWNTAANLTPTAPKVGMATKENIDHFELGLKGTYFDRKLSVNAAVFDTIYKDFQVQIFDQSNTSINPPLILANAGKAETKGVEVDSAVAATDLLRLTLSAAYIDAKFKDYAGAPCYYPDVSGGAVAGCTGTPAVQDLTGKVMPNSPKFKFVLGAEQRLPLGGSSGEVLLGANYSWRDKAQMLVDQNPYGFQPSFGILNLSVGWQATGRKLSVTAFCNNVFDKHYFTDLEDFWSAPWGGTNTIVGQPARDTNRYFGVRLNAGF